MKIQFCGANQEVTGSCHLLITSKNKILVDCGMFQGGKFNAEKNFEEFPFDPKEIDVLIVTHAHLDHVGRIPKLMKEGFQGRIVATKATCKIAPLVMDDAQRIMTYNNQKFQTPILYSMEDVERAERLFEGFDYNTKVDLGEGENVMFKDAGHIYGSSFLEVEADGKRIGFSGDIGNDGAPILKDTAKLGEVDTLLCESTYGDRIHETPDTRDNIIHGLIREAAERGGAIMVPAFSIERTQELLYSLHTLSEQGKMPKMPIYVDSPLAIKVTEVYSKYPEYYDKEACKHYMNGDDFLSFPNLEMTGSREQSKAINRKKPPMLIIAGAGMMNGGRILHHAHRYLSDPKSTLIIVGYQAEGSLGRQLYEGTKKVEIFGDEIPVRCTIKAVGALSAHGDQHKLVSWVGGAESMPKKLYFVHGEPHAANALKEKMKNDIGVDGFFPEYGEIVEI